ncbi:hypothetical protein [Endozoicomonas sp. NE40]|uniref:Uncharacterized protein n=2 Tax=Endozoicomonas lisbonensis TaxID=3120522 RepID=A0ABV2SLC2_9GAMM
MTALKTQINHYQQKPGHKNSVFLLEKSGTDYYLMPCPLFDNTNITIPNLCHGIFYYAILVDYPHQVMVGTPCTNTFIDSTKTIEGHSSISLYRDVLYAGELEFFENKLIGWNNQSGHYRPPPEMRHTQLTPNVKRLLPEESFTDLMLIFF